MWPHSLTDSPRRLDHLPEVDLIADLGGEAARIELFDCLLQTLLVLICHLPFVSHDAVIHVLHGL